MGIKFQELLLSYGIKPKPTTVKNSQANAVVGRIFEMPKKQLRATIFKTNWSEDIDTLIQACAFALQVKTPAHGPYSHWPSDTISFFVRKWSSIGNERKLFISDKQFRTMPTKIESA
jgi:hypothetical protein